MFPIAGQTAGPNELKLFADTHGFFFQNIYFFKFVYGQRQALQLVINKTQILNLLWSISILLIWLKIIRISLKKD